MDVPFFTGFLAASNGIKICPDGLPMVGFSKIVISD
jgi:hypothetical protein